MPDDEGYPAWCDACDWNVAPGLFPHHTDGPDTTWAELAPATGTETGTAVFEELVRTGTEARRARLSPTRLASYGLALLVHGLSPAVLAAGLALLARNWPHPRAAATGAALALLSPLLRPRHPRLTTTMPRLRRPDAPRLFRLLDAVAGELGTRGVDEIVLDPFFNAAVTSYGVRRRVLHLGLGLWYVLTPQQRVALFGHELGHFANGDTRHGLTVGTALHTLRTWAHLLRPERRRHRAAGLPLVLPHRVVQWALGLLNRLSLHGFPRREYLADDLAARVASTEAALGLAEMLLHAQNVEEELGRLATDEEAPGDERLWSCLAEYAAAVPPREHQRLRRVSELTWQHLDTTHPPTHLRMALLGRRGPSASRVVCDARTARAVERELRPAARRLAGTVVRVR
ncbi:M48 family metallopeptidase [Streptomyces sp. NPDC005423]|uniref:M48 family metallopeptidase n=1 Tax=Streptomyces sp. NPDC005423 TaxID=3155343 RepID=UPI0033B5CD42